MIDPNTASTRLTAMETYAQLAEPEYDIPPGGTPAMEMPEYQNGVIPLDTLPAAWWNWMWKTITEQEKRMVRFFNSIFTEFGNLLTAGGVASFDETITNQLVLAIQAVAQTPATTLVCGAIKAGTTFGTLAVDGTTGVATVNGLGDGTLNTVATDITGAINEIDGDIGQETEDRIAGDNALQADIADKAPINHASDEVDTDTGKALYGQADGLNFGHVKLSDDYTDTTLDTTQGVAATPRAVALAVASAGTTYSSVPIGTIAAYGGDITVAPRGWIPCDGRAISRTAYAALYAALGGVNSPWGQGDGSTTFNVPDLRESTLVGTDQGTNPAILEHDVYTLGQFKDDQFQDHGHDNTKYEGAYYLPNDDSGLTDDSISGAQAPMPPGFTTVLSRTKGLRIRGPYTAQGSALRQKTDGSAAAESHAGTYRLYSEAANSGQAGTTTHGKQTGVNYIIKYEDVQADVTLMEYITNQNKLSAAESITPTTAFCARTFPAAEYDGILTYYETYINPNFINGNSSYPLGSAVVQKNGSPVQYLVGAWTTQLFSDAGTLRWGFSIPVQKGDIIKVDWSSIGNGDSGLTSPSYTVQYYKDRDYGA